MLGRTYIGEEAHTSVCVYIPLWVMFEPIQCQAALIYCTPLCDQIHPMEVMSTISMYSIVNITHKINSALQKKKKFHKECILPNIQYWV